MTIQNKPDKVERKSSKYMVFILNDHYEIKINPYVFGICMLILLAVTFAIPWSGIITVPTYLAILFAAVSEKIDFRDEEIFEDSEEE